MIHCHNVVFGVYCVYEVFRLYTEKDCVSNVSLKRYPLIAITTALLLQSLGMRRRDSMKT